MRKAKKSLSEKEFFKLSEKEQVAELKKLTKRANVRLALQEKENIKNDAYSLASYYNEQKGKSKNRFYEGTKYKDASDIKTAFSYVTSYLNSKLSTTQGVKKAVYDKVDSMVSRNALDIDTINEMSKSEKKFVAQRLAKLSNQRLKELEKNNVDYYAYSIAEKFNLEQKRKNNRYYTGGKLSDKDVNKLINSTTKFLKSQSSTIEGLENIYNKRIENFKKKGINISKGDEKAFFDFLSTKEFHALGKQVSSNQIIETFVNARNRGEDIATINKEFKDFLEQTEYTFDKVQEKLKVAKWKGKLFK